MSSQLLCTVHEQNSSDGMRPSVSNLIVKEQDHNRHQRVTKNEYERQNTPHNIDFVATGALTFSQSSLLQNRSIEVGFSKPSDLSARGLHHRTREDFRVQVKTNSAVINQHTKAAHARIAKQRNISLPNYFARGFAYERLGQLRLAKRDYNRCILEQTNADAAFFNRANVHNLLGESEEALQDLNEAVKRKKGSVTYRYNRSLTLRKLNRYIEATNDILICRALSAFPELGLQLTATDNLIISADRIVAPKMMEDPVMLALAVPPRMRVDAELETLCDFLARLRYFAGLTYERSVLRKFAKSMMLESYEKDEMIFNEGDPGDKFYIILDGEASVVKFFVNEEGEQERTVLAKRYRGGTFGETAIENRDKRSAGVVASKPLQLAAIGVESYLDVMANYMKELRFEVQQVLSTSPLFLEWEPSKIESLAQSVVIKAFEANTVIINYAECVDTLYIIKHGMVSLIKPSKHSQCRVPTQKLRDSEQSRELPGLWVLDKNWKDRLQTFDNGLDAEEDTVDFHVGVLGSGQFFGELAVLDPQQKSPLRVQAFTKVEIYCIQGKQMVELSARFNSETMNTLNESMNLFNPPGEKMGYYFRAKFQWEQRKTRLLEEMRRGKSNR